MSELSALREPLDNSAASPSATKWRGWYFLIAFVVLTLDQFTKSLISRRVPLNTGWIDVVPGFFSITHVQNRGAAFSLFSSGTSSWQIAMLIAFSSTAMLAISYFLWKVGTKASLTAASLSLVLGGAVGNLWDRIAHGRVTDFLHFYIGEYSWPDFNVADMAIVTGASLLIVEILFSRSTEHSR